MAIISQKSLREIKDYCQEKKCFKADVSQEKGKKYTSC